MRPDFDITFTRRLISACLKRDYPATFRPVHGKLYSLGGNMIRTILLASTLVLSGCATVGIDMSNPPTKSVRTDVGKALNIDARISPLTQRISILVDGQTVAERHLSMTSEKTFTARHDGRLVAANCETTTRTSTTHVVTCTVRVEHNQAAVFEFVM